MLQVVYMSPTLLEYHKQKEAPIFHGNLFFKLVILICMQIFSMVHDCKPDMVQKGSCVMLHLPP